jgi:hypothetical protein
MAVYSALSAVSAAVFAALNVSAYLTLSPGGVRDDVVLGTAYPFTLYEIQERNLGGLGARPGTTRTLEVDLRLHVFTQQGGWSRAHAAMAKAIELLKTAPAVTGFGSWAIFHDETIPLRSQVISGVVVNELVGNFRLYVTEVA